ncbi:MAG: hypothetical protein WCC36_14385 [Gammaproteobacteria bacterium]
MADHSDADGDSDSAANPGAVVVEGVTRTGKPCRVVDNTGSVECSELEGLLADLIEQDRFGIRGMSAAGENTVTLGAPVFTHIQLGGQVYRLLVLPYEARIERF